MSSKTRKKNFNQLTGREKSAILMISLGHEVSSEILKAIGDQDDLEQLAMEIANMGKIEPDITRQVIEEFYDLYQASMYINNGGVEYARELLSKALGADKAAEILSRLSDSLAPGAVRVPAAHRPEPTPDVHPGRAPADDRADPAPPAAQKASEILVGLAPSQKQIEVVKRIANMEQTNPEVIKEVERGLEHRLSDIVSQTFEKAGGVDTVAEILNLADRSTEKGIMEGLEAEDPDLVEQIRRLMFVFEDILLRQRQGHPVACSRRSTTRSWPWRSRPPARSSSSKIFKNMSERAAQLIKEDMQYMGPVRVSDVEAGAAEDRGARPPAGRRRRNHHRRPRRREGIVI